LKTSHSFPIGLAANWQEPEKLSIPDAKLKNWLLDTGSLTERLQSHCQNFQVQVLGQRQTMISLEEIQQLNHFNSQNQALIWQVREVVLWGDNQPWVFARSIIPDQLCQAEFAGLGNQPLGKLIFNDPRFSRMPFQITQLREPSKITSALKIFCDKPLWARRSIFQFSGLPMSVAELFLPLSPAYSVSTDQNQTAC
jgi:chorismate lyase